MSQCLNRKKKSEIKNESEGEREGERLFGGQKNKQIWNSMRRSTLNLTHTYTHALMRIHTHTHTHIYIYIYIYIYIRFSQTTPAPQVAAPSPYTQQYHFCYVHMADFLCNYPGVEGRQGRYSYNTYGSTTTVHSGSYKATANSQPEHDQRYCFDQPSYRQTTAAPQAISLSSYIYIYIYI